MMWPPENPEERLQIMTKSVFFSVLEKGPQKKRKYLHFENLKITKFIQIFRTRRLWTQKGEDKTSPDRYTHAVDGLRWRGCLAREPEGYREGGSTPGRSFGFPDDDDDGDSYSLWHDNL